MSNIFVLLLTFFGLNAFAQLEVVEGEEVFEMSVVASGILDNPYELIYGPDEWLWITERSGNRVLRVNPQTEHSDILLNDSGLSQRIYGMALDPRFSEGEQSVYLVISTAQDTRLIRMKYTESDGDGQLIDPVDILQGLPKGSGHVSGRLQFSMDDKLHMTFGDLQFNHASNQCNEIYAQFLPVQLEIDQEDYSFYPGKTLRINKDGSIPDDNPLWNGVQSHIYTIGHRNPQGLTLGTNGKLYSDEHGPATDDEVNLLVGGENYGWPYIAGFADGINYAYCNRSSSPDCGNEDFDILVCPPGATLTPELEWSVDKFYPPLASLFVVEDETLLTNNCDTEFICRPGVAPSSIEYYANDEKAIEGWGNSLLVTSLKRGSVYRLKLNENGTEIVGSPIQYFNTVNRYRDIAIGSDNRTFYVISDDGGATLNGDGSNSTRDLANKGSILKFEWVDPNRITTNIDSVICEGDEIQFGDSLIQTSGTYSHKYFSVDYYDSLVILQLEVASLPVVNLGEDIEVDQGMSITLDAGEGFESYRWQDGQISQSITINNITSGIFNYSVEVTDQYGCQAQDEITISVNVVTAIDLNKSEISIYPNPASQKVIIEGLIQRHNTFNLYDLSGCLIRQWTENEMTVELSLIGLAAGTYIFDINGIKKKIIISDRAH